MTKSTRVALAVLFVTAAAVAWSTFKPAAMQDRARWEYCTLKPGWQVDQDTGEARIEYLNAGDTGYRVEVVQAKSSWDTLNDNLADNAFKRAMGKLGSEGWEMVQMVAPDQWGTLRFIYFKRRLP